MFRCLVVENQDANMNQRRQLTTLRRGIKQISMKWMWYTTHAVLKVVFMKLRHVHDIDVVDYPCNIKGCSYEAKEKSNLKIHKAYVHGIGVIYYPCRKCDFEAKSAGHLKAHKANIRDIGVVYYPCRK